MGMSNSTSNQEAVTFFDIVAAMRSRQPISIKGARGMVNAVAAEDGSGRSWNVTIQPAGGAAAVTVYWHE
jgi:hypothetical protein